MWAERGAWELRGESTPSASTSSRTQAPRSVGCCNPVLFLLTVCVLLFTCDAAVVVVVVRLSAAVTACLCPAGGSDFGFPARLGQHQQPQ